MANDDDILPSGYVLQGRYRILHKTGGGGMAMVYKAVDTRLNDRPVAIKEMKQVDPKKQGLDIGKAVRLFKQEAAILSGLNHPYLPHVYGNFQQDGKYYLVMDFIEGETLLQKLYSGSASGRPVPLDVRSVVKYAIQLCEILDYLHSQYSPIIFRDLKPSNIMVDSADHVYLVDFGIARHFKPHQSGDTIVIGTPGYADPEISQINQTNPRSDLYSLGAMLHHCLTTRAPDYADRGFRFPSVSLYNRGVPPRLDELIKALVEPRAENRPASAREVKRELMEIQVVFTGLPDTGGFMPADYDAPTAAGVGGTVRAKTPLAVMLSTLLVGLASGIGFIFSILAAPVLLVVPGARRLPEIFGDILPSGLLIWRPRFVLLLCSLLVFTVVTSVYLLRVFGGSYYAVDLCLSLVLLFTLLVMRQAMSEPIPRSILTGVSIPVLALILAQALEPLVGGGVSTQAAPSPLTASRALTWLLLVLALLSLVGGFITSLLQAYAQPARWRVWVDRLALFALTGTWTFLQYVSGNTEHLPFDGGSSLLGSSVSLTFSSHNTLAVTVNQLLCIPLALIALLLLLRSKNKVTVADRRLLFLAAIPYALLQWNFGPGELYALSPSAGLASATVVNVALFLLLIVAVFIMLRPELDRLDLLDRVALLLLLLSSASLQNFLAGNSASIHVAPLAAHLPTFTFSAALTVVLLATGLLLLLRAGRVLNGLDRVLFSALALSVASIEFAYGQQQVQSMGAASPAANPADMNAFALADLHQILAGVLIVLVIACILIAIIQALLPAYERNTWPVPVLLWIDRFMLLSILLASSLLLFAFSWQGQMLPYLSHPDLLLRQMTNMNAPLITVLLGFVLAILLVVSGLAALLRFFKPLAKGDRLIFLVGSLTCIFLLLTNGDVQHLSLLTASTRHLAGGWSSALTMSNIATAAGLLAALVSLRWLTRPFEPLDRVVLGIVFLVAAALALLQVSHSQLFLALLTLLLGLLIATQMERVRIGTRVI